MAFDPDQFLASSGTATADPGFDPDQFLKETEPKSLAGFGKNAVQDVTGTVKSLVGEGGLAQQLVEHPVDTAVNVVKGLPSAIVSEGKRVGAGELLTGHPINAIKKLGNAAYDKPLSTALSVIPVAGAAGEALGLGGEAARGAELAANASKAIPAVGEMASATAKAAPEAAEAAGAAGKAAGTAAGAGDAGVAGIGKSILDPLGEVRDFVTKKYGQAAQNPSWPQKVAKYLQEESRKLGAKDIGLQPRQVQSMGPGFKGIEKAEQLIDYARDQGYFDPKLTDLGRKGKITATMEKAGQQVDAIRSIADKRGAPPVPDMLNQVKTELTNQYGIDAPREIRRVLQKIEKVGNENPTFSGMSDLATDLNKAKTNMKSLGQHPGPTTDAANIISRMNNDAIRNLLNPQEQEVYTDSLRNYGAHKKLEQAVAASERRGLTARSNQRGPLGRLWQEAMDRGGYRMGGNIADRTARAILKNPESIKTLPQFFEEFAHHANDVLDETLDIHPGMAQGGIVPDDLNEFLSSKYANKKEPKK